MIILFLALNLFSIDVRVLLLETKEFSISSDEPFKVVDSKKRKRFFASKNNYTVNYKDKKIIIGNKKFNEKITIVGSSFLKINKKLYRGKLIVTINNKLTVINEVDLEEYLYGVVPREVDWDWHLELLKAQAVVARSFALKKFFENKQSPYHLTSDITSQVYDGVNAEKKTTNFAVDTTKGEVIIYKDKIINAYYHSNCGGHTENVGDVWETPIVPEYLKGVECDYGKDDPTYHWSKTLTKEYIKKRLNNAGYKIQNIKKISIQEKSKIGRVKIFVIYTDTGNILITGSKLRLILNPFIFRSTMITKLKNNDDSIYIEGKGWGHGVGMCQWGAKELAENGKSYIEIIKFYYPGCKIEEF